MLQSFINLFILKNKAGEPSYSRTMVFFGFLVINIKLLLSGININNKFKMSDFSGTEYGIALAAISALHVGNKKLNGPQSDNKEDK
jgi:hypothetical protein